MHMAETAALRATADNRWVPLYNRLMTLVNKLEFPHNPKANTMTKTDLVLRHMYKTGSISVREAMADYGMSGGHLTKIISQLRNDRQIDIVREMKMHPLTQTKYARYFLRSHVRAGKAA